MRRRMLAVVLVPAMVVLGAGAYAIADAADVAPGWVTWAEPGPSPEPFPSAVGASPDAVPSSPESLLGRDAPLASQIQAKVNAFVGDPRLGSSTGVSVVDLTSGATLASSSADLARIPASNVKILTAAASLRVFGPDRRFPTSVMWDGNRGLTIVAGGDMMLAADEGHYGAKPWANGWAGLGDLADQVAEALDASGVDSVSITYDDSAFPEPRVQSGWPADSVRRGYAAPITGLAVDVGWTGNPDYKRYDDPSRRTADLFAVALAERGVEATVAGFGKAPEGAVEAGRVEGAPTFDVVSYMLTYSENTLAELLARLVALEGGHPGSTVEGTRAVLRALQDIGLDTAEITLADGSGLDRSSRVAPEILTDLLLILASDPEGGDILRDLPVAALSGTLASRFGGTEGAGVVRAKTGTLNGASALSGTIVTEDGSWLGFSILLNGLSWDTRPALAAMDEFVADLAACGCG